MFPNGPASFVLTLIVAISVISTVGLSELWTILAVTLLVTALVAVHRSIPRKER